jgi:hypothetical protein
MTSFETEQTAVAWLRKFRVHDLPAVADMLDVKAQKFPDGSNLHRYFVEAARFTREYHRSVAS